MKLRFAALPCLLFLASICPVFSQEPAAAPARDEETVKLATEVVKLLITTPLDEAKFQRDINAQATMITARLKLDEKAAQSMRGIMANAAKSVTTETFEKIFISSYAETYSKEELAALLAFYRTDLGRSILSKSKQYETSVAMKKQAVVRSLLEQTEAEMKATMPEKK